MGYTGHSYVHEIDPISYYRLYEKHKTKLNSIKQNQTTKTISTLANEAKEFLVK